MLHRRNRFYTCTTRLETEELKELVAVPLITNLFSAHSGGLNRTKVHLGDGELTLFDEVKWFRSSFLLAAHVLGLIIKKRMKKSSS